MCTSVILELEEVGAAGAAAGVAGWLEMMIATSNESSLGVTFGPGRDERRIKTHLRVLWNT